MCEPSPYPFARLTLHPVSLPIRDASAAAYLGYPGQSLQVCFVKEWRFLAIISPGKWLRNLCVTCSLSSVLFSFSAQTILFSPWEANHLPLFEYVYSYRTRCFGRQIWLERGDGDDQKDLLRWIWPALYLSIFLYLFFFPLELRELSHLPLYGKTSNSELLSSTLGNKWTSKQAKWKQPSGLNQVSPETLSF